MSAGYVHGYGAREGLRLHDQAAALLELLHADTVFPDGHRVLEAGCGIGAQTEILARHSPGATIVAVDIEPGAVAATSATVRSQGLRNVSVSQADLFDLPFARESFDDVFACFVLEHVAHPDVALQNLKTVLKAGGTITAIEGDHGSAYFYPESAPARKAISALVELQARANGNALIGRSLFPLLRAAGFQDVVVSPRTVYVDGSRPDLADSFTRKTFTAMVEGVRDAAIAARLIDASEFERGVADLRRAAESDGVFCYTFFKAVATKL
jgi:SAM-dependent methyltransferase